MKETPKSLSIFLFIIGLYGIWNVFGLMANFRASLFMGIISLIGIAFGIITLYIAVRFKYFLQSKVGFLIKFFWIQILFPFLVIIGEIIIIGIGAYLIVNAVVILINFLILYYIIKQVKKLSQQVVISNPPVNSTM